MQKELNNINEADILQFLANFDISKINEETEQKVENLLNEYRNKIIETEDEEVQKRYFETLKELETLKVNLHSYLREQRQNETLDSANTNNVNDKHLSSWVLIDKHFLNQRGATEITRAMFIGNGCLVQVETQQKNPDGSYSIAKAITFVPNVKIQKIKNNYRLVPINNNFGFSNFLKESKGD